MKGEDITLFDPVFTNFARGSAADSSQVGQSGLGPGVWVRQVGTIELQEIKLQGMTYFEDFLEAANALASTVIAKSMWSGSGTNGTQAVSSALPNGTMLLSTTGTASSTSILQFTQTAFSAYKAPTFEAMLQINNVTNLTAKAGFNAPASNWAYVKYDTALSASGLYLSTNNAGAGEVAIPLTGYPGAPSVAAATYVKVRIEILPAVAGVISTGVNVWVNDIQVPPSLITTSLIACPTATPVPYFYLDNKAVAQANTMAIDYVQFSQQR